MVEEIYKEKPTDFLIEWFMGGSTITVKDIKRVVIRDNLIETIDKNGKSTYFNFRYITSFAFACNTQ